MRQYPLSLATLASSPKGTPLGCVENFTVIAKSRPLGEGGLTRSGKTEGASPQRGAFAESGAASAVFLYDPTREKGVQESPQTFLNPELKIFFSAEYAQSERGAHSKLLFPQYELSPRLTSSA